MIKLLIQSSLMYVLYILCSDTQTTHDERTLYNKHVDYRRLLLKCKVPGQPKPIYPEEAFSWDNDLEDLANRQVVACNLSTEYKKAEVEKEYRDTIGINTADNLNVLNAMETWFNEYQLYDYTKNKCKVPKDCLHYKRIVWGSAEFIGCSTGYCSGLTEVKSGKIIVCYYSPMSDVQASRPYEENKIDPCPHPPPITTTTTTTTTRKPITVTRKLQKGPYGRYRCNCKCQP
uniref:Peptidase inhibitor 16 n=1 Tax=Schistosoma haematobium TaxID=6185 RepID=A0A095AFY6_SCHHA